MLTMAECISYIGLPDLLGLPKGGREFLSLAIARTTGGDKTSDLIFLQQIVSELFCFIFI